ncbi:aminotransferase class V-fold PLP-dependent enzyme [Tumidithrix helvetica PCC 7403]|uniref:aminotransferase class V-fold PLP-dependent enzyme n=1 Tax=Tumidithrix helvetica TaxID=3457545 RepID=UPI003C977D54
MSANISQAQGWGQGAEQEDISASALQQHRSHYPALNPKAKRAYFNYGGQGVMCEAALNAIARGFEQIESLGCFSIAAFQWIEAEKMATRQAIATELQVSPNTITLTDSTTTGCNIVLWSVDWQQGDRLLLSDCEHPGIIAIAAQLQTRFGIEIDYFPLQQTLNGSDDFVLEAIEQALQPRTRMIAISHICWNTGQVLPLKEIGQLCRDRQVLVVVDAAQSVGVLPLNLAELGIDFYAFTGHKWWCAPLGLGGVYVAPEAFAAAQPTFIGWRSIVSGKSSENRSLPKNYDWRADGQKFEVASATYPLYAGLRAAIAHANLWGTQQERYDRIGQLSDRLWHKLAQIPQIDCIKQAPPKVGLVSFKMLNKASNLVMQQLEVEHQILIRSIPDPDCLRVSLHYLTTETEIDQLVSVLARF